MCHRLLVLSERLRFGMEGMRLMRRCRLGVRLMLRVASQGTSLALEDALAVAHKVQKHGLTPTALRRYEAQRLARVLPVQVTIGVEAARAWSGKGAEGLIRERAMPRHMRAFMHRLFAYQPKPLVAPPEGATARARPSKLTQLSTACRLKAAQLRSAAAVAPTLVAAHMRMSHGSRAH